MGIVSKPADLHWNSFLPRALPVALSRWLRRWDGVNADCNIRHEQSGIAIRLKTLVVAYLKIYFSQDPHGSQAHLAEAL
jgi:hypothetical protein